MKGLDKEDYKLFVEDALQNCIIVGGACRNGCSFCSCKAQAAAGLKNWTEYISLEDLRSVLHYIDPNKTIYFGEGVSFLSCEPFQHPQYLDLLELLNQHFPNTPKRTTTICKGIDPQHYDRLRRAKITFVAGINTLDRQKRRALMKGPEDYSGVVSFLDECAELIDKISLLYTGDLEVLERDLDQLYAINPALERTRIMLRLPEYSMHHNSVVRELHYYAKQTWHAAIRLFDDKVEKPQYWLRSLSDFPQGTRHWQDEQGLNIHDGRASFQRRMDDVRQRFGDELKKRRVAMLLAESVWDYCVATYPELEANAIKVRNRAFKGSYQVAGLLSRDDLLGAVKDNPPFLRYLVPKDVFPRFKRDILGHHLDWNYGSLALDLI